MTVPDALMRFLDARAAKGRPLELWWRDDDLETPTAALSACLDALAAHRIVAAFAAIPVGLSGQAVEALAESGAVLFVHGWSHTNHAAPGSKKCEFGPDRPLADRLAEIAGGWRHLQERGGAMARPCFVPPWNRLGDDLLAALDRSEMAALSAFAPAGRRPPAAALPRLDAHVDLIDWRGTGGPISAAELIARLSAQDGVDGPVGILSHHRVTDPGAWAAWRPVLAALSEHPAARWLTPDEALARVGAGPVERRTG